jgi:hypothetical protein
MKEAVVTIYVPATDGEPAHTEVWRVEFEGERTNTLAGGFQLHRVVHTEQLVARSS